MLNYETLLSAYDDKLTLMQWLKKVEAALKDASAVSFNVNKRGDATLTFSVVFEDGSELESNPITLQQGESVASAEISNGHLLLTLTNGAVLDSGNLFNGNVELNGNLKVNGLATLPSIEGDENGDINVDGDIIVSEGGISISDGAVSTPILTSQNDYIEAEKPVIEVMTGYSMSQMEVAGVNFTPVYGSIVKNGNKLTIVYSSKITRTASVSGDNIYIASIVIPVNISNKLFPILGSSTLARSSVYILDITNNANSANIIVQMLKMSAGLLNIALYPSVINSLALNDEYYLRYEITFLLSENML